MNWFPALLASVKKETRLILRDKEALAILFILPAVFVLIMSLALEDAFSERGGVRFSLLIANEDTGLVGKTVANAFSRNKAFQVQTLDSEPGRTPVGEARLQEYVRKGRYQFIIHIGRKATEQARERAKKQLGLKTKTPGPLEPVTVRLLADPALRADHRQLVVTALNRVLQELETGILLQQFEQIRLRLARLGMVSAPKGGEQRVSLFTEVRDPYAADAEREGPMPTAVQQNAPGWGLLAMFILVIPLAGTLVREQQEGSLRRLQTMAAPMGLLLGGKVVPYFFVNQIQMGLIFLEGVYLVPLLGGQRLDMGDAPAAVALLSASISVAAIGYGLMVAAFCRTGEQATAFGAASVLILGALGGIMVPKQVMPEAMQGLTLLSPMSWGLEGFLDIFVRGGGVREVLGEAWRMLAFGGLCFGIGLLRFGYKLRHN